MCEGDRLLVDVEYAVDQRARGREDGGLLAQRVQDGFDAAAVTAHPEDRCDVDERLEVGSDVGDLGPQQ